jgi:hypothetical protein
MNTEKRKRQDEYPNDVKRKIVEDTNYVSQLFQYKEIRYDFSSSIEVEDGDVSSLLANLAAIKQQLNDVKSLLSDKDIADWNRFNLMRILFAYKIYLIYYLDIRLI